MRRGFLVLCALGLVGFGTRGGAQQSGGSTVEFYQQFYPMEVGTTWTYALGNKEVVVTVEKKEDRVIIRKNDKGEDKKQKVSSSRLVITSGEKRLTEHVAVLEDGIYRLTSAGKDITPPLRILRYEQGAPRWDCDSISENIALKGSFASNVDSVTVPFSATPIQAVTATCPEFQIGTQKMAIQYWFAPKVGIVKQRVKMENHDLTLELKEFKAGK